METKSSGSEANTNFDNKEQLQNETACLESPNVQCSNNTDSEIQILNSHNNSPVHPDVCIRDRENSQSSDSSALKLLTLSHSETECNNSSKVKSDGNCVDGSQNVSESSEFFSSESQLFSNPRGSKDASSQLKPEEINGLSSVQTDVVVPNKTVSAKLEGCQDNSVSKIEFPESLGAANLNEVPSGVCHSAEKLGDHSSPRNENTNSLCKISSYSDSDRSDSSRILDLSTDKTFFVDVSSDANCCRCNTADSPALKESLTLNAPCITTDIGKSGDLKVPANVSPAQGQENPKILFMNRKSDVPGASDTDSVSNLSSAGDLESTNEVDFLRRKIDDLTMKLLRSQEQVESLLEEKQKWLTASHQQSLKHKANIAPDTTAVVVKFAQSEQQRMKAEARIKELEAMISRIKPDKSLPPGQCGPMEELNKALIEARERAENLRHSLRQEETKVSDLNAKLNATREAHRNEQKRAAGQAEVINKLNRDIDGLKRQLKNLEKIREREAKRLCDEMTVRETTEKYSKALADIDTLKGRIAELEEVEKSKSELESKYEDLSDLRMKVVATAATFKQPLLDDTTPILISRRTTFHMGPVYFTTSADPLIEDLIFGLCLWTPVDDLFGSGISYLFLSPNRLQRAHDSLVSVREEMATCMERETQLSEFTRRLTERTAGLQSAHLVAQERLAASEKAVAEASRAAREATELLQVTEARAQAERAETTDTIARLEARISELMESEASLKADLTREQVEKAALKRKQHGLDRELARLVAQQRKRSIQQQHQQQISVTSHKSDSVSEKSSTGSNLSLSVITNPPAPEVTQDSVQPSVLGNALLATSVAENGVSATSVTSDDVASMSALEVQTLEPNRNLLLNKIDRLQRTNVRLMEKIDFMHEHISQLTLELQKKSKILQNCLFREAENEGAAVPASADANKRQRMRRGGTLMAAVFAGDTSAAGSDLRTSLQLNQKLQSVLEDTLYKNLTLKENVDTLADEVARLKRANSELKTLVSAQHLRETEIQR
ncbi:hypothetical protein Aperf_G00000068173 [Anoplocephala perfoliata]